MRLTLLLPALLLFLSAPGCSGGGEPSGSAGTTPLVSQVWARVSLPPHESSAAFLVVENPGTEEIRLVAASSPRAETTELHSMEIVEEVMKMRRVESFPIPAGGRLVLEPGSHHLMFFDLDGPWVVDEQIPITLEFADGLKVAVQATVRLP